MQPEDSQIDVLLKRYGRQAGSGVPVEHLDADELNAFAERSAPAAARSRYVSHLAECEDCRKLATQLSIAAGATANVGAGVIETASGSFRGTHHPKGSFEGGCLCQSGRSPAKG